MLKKQLKKILPRDILPLPPPPATEEEARFKYIDDMTLCQVVNLKDLEEINEPVDRPLNSRDRTMHFLPESKNKLQKTINDVHKFSDVQRFYK